ncbi:hypothetical protein Kpol_2001p27 [Vanderwaltozyma polyspora DSM 70294]|uniref:J protein JJJ2 n=1 Tax=Vanderwaltozyma polyspora (strain ATCC 22028 / DSM 70294 / BCRC 21397 / CBS 2163 / NBRC 10782 / NRRL Y-8283 / UCD 57-17) TaxID=436907 RepID=JJJ2_VANPO|nr:uncharacterized protein Kpol_2001p27 [Vanderwaltozyma polyspora DSM 70294]A7TGR0.1 RecName: Full=J protein JJJ2 [Vanderwaltozyma polyspora DSM 70294]EDO18523.1 hypothetical protein Kpol_2001p27 [Vanderwaltozyma polyspora DSM 70294]
MKIDETTYYSVLGLPTTANKKDIHKSYLRLARKLHPDKSKSNDFEELFKVVVQAHSILTDISSKQEYDAILKRKGLSNYTPLGYKEHTKKQNQSNNLNQQDASKNSKKNDGVPTQSKVTRKNKPYEQQPYGFGLDFNEGSKMKKDKQKGRNTSKNSKEQQGSQETTNTSENLQRNAKGNKNNKNPRKDRFHTLDNSLDTENDNKRRNIKKAKDRTSKDQNTYSHTNYQRKRNKVKFTQGSIRMRNPEATQSNPDLQNDWDPLKDIISQFGNSNIQDDFGIENIKPSSDPRTFELEDLSLDCEYDFVESNSRVRRANMQNVFINEMDRLMINDPLDMSSIKHSLYSIPYTKRQKTSQSTYTFNDQNYRFTERLPRQENSEGPFGEIPSVFESSTGTMENHRSDFNLRGRPETRENDNIIIPEMMHFPDAVTSKEEEVSLKTRFNHFNEDCNRTKEYILKVLKNRISVDKDLSDMMTVPEYHSLILATKSFDVHLSKQLLELNELQFNAGQRYTELFKSIQY